MGRKPKRDWQEHLTPVEARKLASIETRTRKLGDRLRALKAERAAIQNRATVRAYRSQISSQQRPG